MILYQLLVSSTLFVLILSKPGPGPHDDDDGPLYPGRPTEGVALYAEYFLKEIPNYSILNFDDFSDNEAESDGNAVLEGIWCQSSYSDSGTWYSPDHTTIPVYTEPFGHDHDCTNHDYKDIVPHPEKNCYPDSDPPIFSAQFQGQTVLLRDRDSMLSLTEADSGLYYCVIANQTLVVGIYTTTSNVYNGPIATSIRVSVEPIDGGIISGSSEAVLTFNVSNGPPTNITCTGPNNWVIYETSDQVTRSVIDRDTTGVSIVLNQLELLEGSIQCNVSNIVDVATTAINIKSEESLTVKRLGSGLALYEVSWTGPTYTLYYSIPELNISTMALGTTSDNTIIANLSHIITSDTTGAFSNGGSYPVLFYVTGSSNGTGIDSISSIESTIAAIHGPSVTNMTSSLNSISIQFEWSVVPSNGYTVVTICWTLCDSDSLNTTQQSSNASNHVVIISELNPGMVCNVSVHGHYSNNNDDDVIFMIPETIQTTYTVPSLPPTDIEVVSVSSDSVIVQWDMVPCNGQHGPIHGYHIQYMPTTGHSTEVYHRSTNESMVTLSDLSPYTNYSVTVTPYNSAGNGTRPIQLQIQTNESVPGIVSDIMINLLNDTSIIVSWNEPLMKNGHIMFYDIRLNHTTRGNDSSSTQYTTDGNMVEVVIGLSLHSVKYTVSIRAHTSIGPGDWVSMEYIRLTEISNVSLSRMDDSIQLSWSRVIDDNLVRIVIQLSLFPHDHIYEAELSKDSTFILLPPVYGNITIFGVYLIDNELYNSAGMVVEYDGMLSQTTCSNVPIPSVTGRDEGLNLGETNSLSGVYIAIIVILSIALGVSILVIIALAILLRRKSKQAEQEITTERMNSFEYKRKLSSKDDTYVEMSSSDNIVAPQYENIPSTPLPDMKSTNDEYCDGGDTINTDDSTVPVITPDDQHKGSLHEQDLSQSGVYESIL